MCELKALLMVVFIRFKKVAQILYSWAALAVRTSVRGTGNQHPTAVRALIGKNDRAVS